MKLYELELRMQKVLSIPQLNAVFKQCLQQRGIATFSYTYYLTTPGSTNKIKHDFCSANYQRWHQHYIESGYEDIDSSFDLISQNIMPIYWSVIEQIKNACSKRERQMREDSYAFGARRGLLIPIYGIKSELATFVIIEMAGDTCLQEWEEKQYELFVIGNLYYKYLQPFLLDVKVPEQLLTKREFQCLKLTANQISVAQQAKLLLIKERTVNFHLQNANKKLGVKNKHQAVLKAMQLGLLELGYD